MGVEKEKKKKITVLAHGEGEVVVPGGVERDACGEPRRPLCPRRRRSELDGQLPRGGAAGGRMQRRRRAAADLPHRGKAVRHNGKVVGCGCCCHRRWARGRRRGELLRRRSGRELRGRAVHACPIRFSLLLFYPVGFSRAAAGSVRRDGP